MPLSLTVRSLCVLIADQKVAALVKGELYLIKNSKPSSRFPGMASLIQASCRLLNVESRKSLLEPIWTRKHGGYM
ncbi:uncharacterized protein LAJ45_09497 [Morchella importuna]|uniref:uncharacterized protein n=1 Tax=Morchella importuna TaxID=1174673 RepID=UPI001E8ED91A|nr:uncharacterized protein LAJ45_09497 [Morchella importuna]KAH8146551.1 hypothetical protein LAJ45_09497 [Morchella importuna]